MAVSSMPSIDLCDNILSDHQSRVVRLRLFTAGAVTNYSTMFTTEDHLTVSQCKCRTHTTNSDHDTVYCCMQL